MKALYIFIFLVILNLITINAASWTGNPDHDAYVWSDYPTTNYNNGNLYIDQGVDILIHFNLTNVFQPATPTEKAIVSSTTLALYETHGWVNTPGFNFYEVTSSWAENTVTYNTRPSYGNYLFNVGTPATGWNYYSQVQIKQLVENWLNGTSNNYGLVLDCKNQAYEDVFLSSESASNKPYLTFSWTTQDLAQQYISSAASDGSFGEDWDSTDQANLYNMYATGTPDSSTVTLDDEVWEYVSGDFSGHNPGDHWIEGGTSFIALTDDLALMSQIPEPSSLLLLVCLFAFIVMKKK